MEEDWGVLLSFFPDNWLDLASTTGVLKGLRQDKAAENYLRTLLLHVGCGHSLRETAARAKLAYLADLSDAAVLARLRKAKDWLHHLCVALFEEKGIARDPAGNMEVRLFDATNVKESGKTGSLWRIHYSLRFPSLACDFFKLTPSKGQGTGESFFQYSIKKGDYIIADRGYSTGPGIRHAVSKKAFVMVRVNTSSLPLLDPQGKPFPLLESVTALRRPGVVGSWKVAIPSRSGPVAPGRVCAVRKTEEAIRLTHEKLRKNARRKGSAIKPETFEYAKYVIVYSNYPEDRFSPHDLLDWYKCRWQVELVFKRFKSVAQLGHLPKHSDSSSKAWLYGKLFVALLTMKLIDYATSISPWGYPLFTSADPERLA